MDLTVEEDGRLVVMAFDPGVTTGWAGSCFDRVTLLDDSEVSVGKRLRCGRWETGEINRQTVSWEKFPSSVARRALSSFEGWDSFNAREMLRLARWWWEVNEVDLSLDVFVVVQEDFILQTRDAARHTLAPVRVNAAFDMLTDEAWQMRKIKFMASDAKNVVTDMRLRNWRMYELGKGVEHIRDGLRHNILFVRKWATEPRFRARFEVPSISNCA